MAQTPKEDKPKRASRRRGTKRSRSEGTARPVPLYKRSSSHFATEDRRRGEAHKKEGRVHLDIDGSRCRATIEATEGDALRQVGVDWRLVPERRALHAHCGCEQFAEGRACEHLWAVLVALGEAGDEAQPAGKDRVGLRKDRANRWADLNGGLPTYPDTGANPSVVHAKPPEAPVEPAGDVVAVKGEVTRRWTPGADR